MSHGPWSVLTLVGLLSLVTTPSSAQELPPAGQADRAVAGIAAQSRLAPLGYPGRGVLRRLPPVQPQRPPGPRPYALASGDPRLQPRSQPARSEGATVRGRLSDRGRPLVGCRVAIVRIPEASDRYAYAAPDAKRPLLTATTDQNGEYAIPGVPPGSYKLTWLPAGTRQWIRRISLRPDVRVRDSEDVWLKEIRVAMHTVN